MAVSAWRTAAAQKWMRPTPWGRRAVDARLLTPGERKLMLYSPGPIRSRAIGRACIEVDMRRRGTAAALVLTEQVKHAHRAADERQNEDNGDRDWLSDETGGEPLPPAELRQMATALDARSFMLHFLRWICAFDECDAAHAIPQIVTHDGPWWSAIGPNAGSVARILIGMAGDAPSNWPLRAHLPEEPRVCVLYKEVYYRRGLYR